MNLADPVSPVIGQRREASVPVISEKTPAERVQEAVLEFLEAVAEFFVALGANIKEFFSSIDFSSCCRSDDALEPVLELQEAVVQDPEELQEAVVPQEVVPRQAVSAVAVAVLAPPQTLHEAVLRGDYKAVRALCTYENVLEQDERGMTALHHAVLAPQTQDSWFIISSLMHKVDGDRKIGRLIDNQGRTVLDAAYEADHQRAIRSMESETERGRTLFYRGDNVEHADYCLPRQRRIYRPPPTAPVWLCKQMVNSEPEITQEEWRELMRCLPFQGIRVDGQQVNRFRDLAVLNRILPLFYQYEDLEFDRSSFGGYALARIQVLTHSLAGITREDANRVRELMDNGVFEAIFNLLYEEHPLRVYFSGQGKDRLLAVFPREKSARERVKESAAGLREKASGFKGAFADKFHALKERVTKAKPPEKPVPEQDSEKPSKTSRLKKLFRRIDEHDIFEQAVAKEES